MCVLPDHLHCIWTLPPDDADFSKRWRLIKSEFTRQCPDQFRRQRSIARQYKGEQAVWQWRFWEHQLCDEADFVRSETEGSFLNPTYGDLRSHS